MQRKLTTLFTISLFFSSTLFAQSLYEDFSAGVLPAGWTNTSASMNDSWEYGQGVDQGSFTSVILDADGNMGEYANIDFSDDPDTTALVLPALSLAGISNPEFSFFLFTQSDDTASFSPLNRLIVDYWDGASWVNIDVLDTLTTQGWTQYTYDPTLYTYNTDSVRFRLVAQEGGAAVGGTGTFTFQQDIAIDNVFIGNICDLVSVNAVTDSVETCFVGGGVSAIVSGATGPISYLWSSGDTIASPTDLMGGTYTVTITDSLGCTATDSATVAGYTEIQTFLSVIDPTCDTTGWIVIDSTIGGEILTYECGDGSGYTCSDSTQTTTIGTGTMTNDSTTYPAPYGNWYWGARHQIMYRKSELNAMGIVGPTLMQSIAFDVDTIVGTNTYIDYEIQMGCTSDTSMDDWKTVSTVVFPADTVVIDSGRNTHIFSIPYFWDGESNLVVQLCFNNSGFTDNSLSPYTATSYNSVIYYRADNPTVCSNTTSTTGTSPNRANTTFTHCAVETPEYLYDWSNGSTSGDTLAGLAPGTYAVTITDAFGCSIMDSVTLAVPFVTGADTVSICDSFTWIDSITYTSSTDSATFTLTTSSGCDSVVTLDLTILESNVATDAIAVCDSSFTWIDGITYTASNDSATFVLTNSAGCDSTVTLDLTLTNLMTTVTDSAAMLTADQAGARYQWLDCDNGFAPIADSTARTFTASSSGSYAVEITLDGCVDTSACMMVIASSIETDLGGVFSLFPNPTSGNFTIVSENVVPFQVRVYNSVGQMVRAAKSQETNLKLDLSHQAKGVYQVEIVTEAGRLVKKVLLQ